MFWVISKTPLTKAIFATSTSGPQGVFFESRFFMQRHIFKTKYINNIQTKFRKIFDWCFFQIKKLDNLQKSLQKYFKKLFFKNLRKHFRRMSTFWLPGEILDQIKVPIRNRNFWQNFSYFLFMLLFKYFLIWAADACFLLTCESNPNADLSSSGKPLPFDLRFVRDGRASDALSHAQSQS